VPDEAPTWTEFGLDLRVAAFAVGATVLTTLLFGWAPALHAFTGNVQSAMHDATKGTTVAPSGRRTLRLLVGAECALAMLLLVCGGLLLRAYDRVRQIDPGFRTDHVLTFRIMLPETTYPDSAKRNAFWDRLEERLQSLPGVERAGLVSCAPLGCHEGNFFTIEGRPEPVSGDADPVVLSRRASPNYFQAMGIRLAHGRFFEPGENRGDGARVAVVNETFARTFWPDVPNPVGRRFKGRGNRSEWLTVVGVAMDVRHYGLEKPMRPGIYLPLRARGDDNVTVALHSRVDPQSLIPTAEALVRELDAELPIYRVRTMEQALAQSMRIRAVYSWMLGVFAALALVLALGGAYGVSAYLVAQRSRELAIRVALGARSADIFRSVLGSTLATVGSGALLGVAASLLTARLLASLLFGVSPHDATVLGTTVTVLLTTALAATLWPARRAARVDPASSLRAE
jgi:predicted permease